jgi:hypothetical protein
MQLDSALVQQHLMATKLAPAREAPPKPTRPPPPSRLQRAACEQEGASVDDAPGCPVEVVAEVVKRRSRSSQSLAVPRSSRAMLAKSADGESVLCEWAAAPLPDMGSKSGGASPTVGVEDEAAGDEPTPIVPLRRRTVGALHRPQSVGSLAEERPPQPPSPEGKQRPPPRPAPPSASKVLPPPRPDPPAARLGAPPSRPPPPAVLAPASVPSP